MTMEWRTLTTRDFERRLKMCSPPSHSWLHGSFAREIMITLVTRQRRSLIVPDQSAGIFQTSIARSPGKSLVSTYVLTVVEMRKTTLERSQEQFYALDNWSIFLCLINFGCLVPKGSDKELQLVLVDTVLLSGITDDHLFTQPLKVLSDFRLNCCLCYSILWARHRWN